MMNDDDSDQLKPCPFCGSDAEFGSIDEGPNIGGHFVQCLSSACGASSALIYPLMDDIKNLLLERWNWRAVVVAPAAPAAPAVREPLTDEQIDALWRAPMSADWEHREFARAIERAHGITGDSNAT